MYDYVLGGFLIVYFVYEWLGVTGNVPTKKVDGSYPFMGCYNKDKSV